MSNVTLKQMAKELPGWPEYTIYYHKKPDGDAIGSAHALCLALQSVGIRCALRCHDPVPPLYRYLTDRVKQDEPGGSCRTIAVDSVSPKRLGKYESVPIDFCIDHHEHNAFKDALQYTEEDSASCAEIILKLIEEMKIEVTRDIASLLYTGLVTDTMCFRTSGTNAACLRTAAKLAEYGADIVEIARRHCLLKSPRRMEIERILINSFHYTADGRVLGCYFAHEDMIRIGIGDDELEGLNSVVDQMEGIIIGIVVRETVPGLCRVSVRTMDHKYNAAEICAVFGGGGHIDRAGCEISASPQEALASVEEACVRFLS